MYYKHLVSPTRDHQMTTLITEPRQDESYTNPITLEPISTTPELNYDETSECTQQENPVQPETNQMEVTTTQHSQSEHVPLRRSTRISKRPNGIYSSFLSIASKFLFTSNISATYSLPFSRILTLKYNVLKYQGISN